jgi:ribosome-binding factor A
MSTQRALRVSQLIKRELSQMILRDIEDERITGIVSITDVESTNDCRSVKIFVSVFGSAENQESTITALSNRASYIRGELGRRLKLKFAPEIQFHLDNSLERGAQVSAIIAKISRGEV